MKMRTLHVLSYNIHKGFSATRVRFTLGKIRECIRQVHADLVFLQEVVGHHRRHAGRMKDSPASSQFEYLADSVWPHYAYGRNAVYSAGHHGNAILSKYPVTVWENLDVSNSRLERRGLLHASIAVPGLPEHVHAICLHFDLMEAGRRRQVDRLCERIADAVPAGAPLIVAGDFNDWRQRVSEVLERRLQLREAFMTAHGEHARTFPVWRPTFRLDRIYVRGLDVKSARTYRDEPWNRLSDHAALFSELQPHHGQAGS